MLAVGCLVALGTAIAGSQQTAGAAQVDWQSNAIQTVLASQQGSDFRYFPHSARTASCALPFEFRIVKGTCTSKASLRPANNSGEVWVTLTERWRWKAFHYSGAPRRMLHHWWLFAVSQSGKVTFIKHRGDFPPNFAR